MRVPAAVLTIGLLITGFAGWASAAGVRSSRLAAFDDLAHDARTAIQRRLAAYSEALFGLRSLFSTRRSVGRQEFRDYVDLSAIQQRLPGIQGLSFVRLVHDPDLPSFVAAVRADRSIDPGGYPTFTVNPVLRARDHFIADYIEPRAGNEKAFGFDLASSDVRLHGLEEARDTGELIASSPLRLVQDVADRRGFLLFLGVYNVPRVPVTEPARRRHLVGFVDAIFRTRDLLESVLGTSRRLEIPEVYDVGASESSSPGPMTAEGELTRTQGSVSALTPGSIPGLHRFLDLDVGSRRWRILAIPSRAYGGGAQLALPWIVTAAGILLSLLLAGLVFSFADSRARALTLAADMTADLRQREHELEESNVQLSATNNAVREFVAIASHDMRSPLTTLIGFTRVLRDSWEKVSQEEREQYLDVMQRRGDDLARLVDDLLLTSEIEAGALNVHREAIALDALFERRAAEFASSERLETHCPDGLAVRADPNHLTRILTNYLDNAVKYGSVPFRLDATASNGWVEIRILDGGAGVPDAFLPRLFDKFARADSDGKTGVTGTGLGLSIVRGLARANGGEAWYEPLTPQGACFAVRLRSAS